jgi:hypothetical protein
MIACAQAAVTAAVASASSLPVAAAPADSTGLLLLPICCWPLLPLLFLLPTAACVVLPSGLPLLRSLLLLPAGCRTVLLLLLLLLLPAGCLTVLLPLVCFLLLPLVYLLLLLPLVCLLLPAGASQCFGEGLGLAFLLGCSRRRLRSSRVGARREEE